MFFGGIFSSAAGIDPERGIALRKGKTRTSCRSVLYSAFPSSMVGSGSEETVRMRGVSKKVRGCLRQGGDCARACWESAFREFAQTVWCE